MPSYYFDTSALVKLYLREPGSSEAARLAEQAAPGQLMASALARVEGRAAFRALARRKEIPADAADELIARLNRDMDEVFLLQPVSDAVLQQAGALLDRRALRAYDAVQLASCLVLAGADPPCFVCSDRALLRTAGEEGLEIFDPADGR
ncbi:MAG: type II toxin-antitoxin system VapC family toxin [Terriglobales bacterium]